MAVDDSLKRFVPIAFAVSAVAGLLSGTFAPLELPAPIVGQWWLLLIPWLLVTGVVTMTRAMGERPHRLVMAICYIAIVNLLTTAAASLIFHRANPAAVGAAYFALSFGLAGLLGTLFLHIGDAAHKK
jgi:uncharacterized membrane protein